MIKVIKRISLGNRWGYQEVPNDCKTYAATIKKFGGTQDWFDKKEHRFMVGNDLYLMSKE